MEQRPATRDEIAAYFRNHRKVRFEHWIRETYAPRARYGVRHQRHSSRVLEMVDGVPTVMYRGDRFEVFATHYTLPNGRTFVALPTLIRPERGA